MLAQITKGDRLILYFERFSRLAFGAKPDNATVKLEVQLRHRLPPSLERSGKGGGRRW